MDWGYITIPVTIINFFIGLLIFLKNRKSSINISFTLFIWLASLWALTLFIYDHPVVWDSFVWIKITYVLSSLMVITVFYFSHVFPERKQKPSVISMVVYFLGISVIWAAIYFNYFVEEVILLDGEYHAVIYKPTYIVYSVFGIIYFTWAIVILIKKYLRLKGPYRLQLKYLFSGFIVFALSVMTADVIIPVLFDITKYYWVSALATLFLTIFTGYAIVRYRLMDIRLVVKKGLVYISSIIILISFLLGIYLVVNSILGFGKIETERMTIGLIIFGIGLLFFNKLLNLINSFLNKYFFKTLYTSRQAIEDITEKATTIIQLDKLLSAIVDTIKKSMGLERAGVLLINNRTDNYETGNVSGFNLANGISLVRNNYLTQSLIDREKPIILQELELMNNHVNGNREKSDIAKLISNMKHIEASLCLPLITKKKLLGIIVLGDKISNEAFTKEDLDLLQTLASQATVAIENARLYQEVQGFSKTLEDKVDEQTKEIREKNIHLEELLEMKSEFLTIASHQLRTPTSIIRGFLSSLIDEELSDKEKIERAKQAFEGANRLERIINDILVATELEGKKIRIDFRPIDLVEVTQEVLAEARIIATDKDLKFEFKKSAKFPKILADSLRLKEAVSNIVDNAVFYTEKGRITVSLEKQGKYAKISIKDTGIGFTKEVADNLGKKFFRAPGASLVHPNGSGLGLFIAKVYIEAMKGKIEFSSPGKSKGSTFSLFLPLTQKT